MILLHDFDRLQEKRRKLQMTPNGDRTRKTKRHMPLIAMPANRLLPHW